MRRPSRRRSGGGRGANVAAPSKGLRRRGAGRAAARAWPRAAVAIEPALHGERRKRLAGFRRESRGSLAGAAGRRSGRARARRLPAMGTSAGEAGGEGAGAELLLLVNATSGRGRARRWAEWVVRELASAGRHA